VNHLNLEVLRTFVSIVDLNGFNKAAQRMHRTQSAISMQMKNLEELTGHTLLEKKGKKHLLTHQGEILLGYARRMLDLHDQALLMLKDTTLKGFIRIGIQYDFVDSSLPQILFRFAKMYPAIVMDWKVDSSQALVQQLSAGKLDMAVYLGNDVPSDVHHIRVGSFPLQWMYSPSNSALPEPGKPIPLAVLGPTCKMRQMASFALNDAGMAWRVAFTSTSLAAMWGAVHAGIGIGVRTTIGLPAALKVVPDIFGLPALPVVNAYICTAQGENSKPVSTLQGFLLSALEEKGLG
jgi:DNA-binding transcriptional LysR family regulator